MLFSGKNKKNISICCLLIILPRVLNVNEVFSRLQLGKQRETYMSKFLVSGRSLNFSIASGLLSGSFSRTDLPER